MDAVPRALAKAASNAGRSLPLSTAERLASELWAAGDPGTAKAIVPGALTTRMGRAIAEAVIDVWASHPDVPARVVGACVAAAACAHDDARAHPTTELVLSGPRTLRLNPRRTEQVLLGLIGTARESILLVTYALYMYSDLKSALSTAQARGVSVTVLAEDPNDNQNFTGDPAKALADLAPLRLRWISEKRQPGASMHAKMVIVDSQKILVTSANLTSAANGKNLEAGLLVTGGPLPQRLLDYVTDLQADGFLHPSDMG